MRPVNLKRFALSETESAAFDKEFRLIVSKIHLRALESTTLSIIPSASGCYFWVMPLDSVRYKIYLGRTRSLRKRVTDYTNDFQVHAPNDYKLRFFQESIATALPEAALALYFTEVPLTDCKTKETQLVRRFAPLINTLPPATETERALIRRAFEEYYRLSITRHLAG